MSHPQEPSDKMKEEAEVKACCGNDKHQHADKMEEKPNAQRVLLSHALRRGQSNDEPGRCPVCGMYLEKDPIQRKRQQKNPVAVQKESDKEVPSAAGKYYCPMHCEGDKVYEKRETALYAEWI
jgi:Cu2+-exporting ATPase